MGTRSGRPLTCLIIGCGVQGRSHLEAFAATLPLGRVLLHSRSPTSAAALAGVAATLGLTTEVIVEVIADAADLSRVLPDCHIVACCTPGLVHCLTAPPRDDAFVAAVGAFTPKLAEIAPDVVRAFGTRILLDTPDARHEAGDLLQAGVDPAGLPTLLDAPAWVPRESARGLLFKSCGSALWDLAAARVVGRDSRAGDSATRLPDN